MGTQLSVFVENRPGKLEAIAKALAERKVNIRGISVASAGEYGVVKIIADDPNLAYELLRESGFTVSRRSIVIVLIEDLPGSLYKLLETLSGRRVNIEDCYGIVLEEGKKAAMVLEVEKYPEAERVLQQGGYKVLTDREIHSI